MIIKHKRSGVERREQAWEHQPVWQQSLSSWQSHPCRGHFKDQKCQSLRYEALHHAPQQPPGKAWRGRHYPPVLEHQLQQGIAKCCQLSHHPGCQLSWGQPEMLLSDRLANTGFDLNPTPPLLLPHPPLTCPQTHFSTRLTPPSFLGPCILLSLAIWKQQICSVTTYWPSSPTFNSLTTLTTLSTLSTLTT